MLLIAEIGQNHCGDMKLARYLIDKAKVNGADLVKFQLYDSEKLYGEKQTSELTKNQAYDLFHYGKEQGIEVFFSVFDIERVDWCEEIGVKRYKVAYSQKYNRELWDKIATTRKPIIASMKDGHPLIQYEDSTVYPLWCVPNYPASIEDYNIMSFVYWEGISDHTIGIQVAQIALARGARIIEKHFAIDHNTGVDAPWSMIPSELKELDLFRKVVNISLNKKSMKGDL